MAMERNIPLVRLSTYKAMYPIVHLKLTSTQGWIRMPSAVRTNIMSTPTGPLNTLWKGLVDVPSHAILSSQRWMRYEMSSMVSASTCFSSMALFSFSEASKLPVYAAPALLKMEIPSSGTVLRSLTENSKAKLSTHS